MAERGGSRGGESSWRCDALACWVSVATSWLDAAAKLQAASSMRVPLAQAAPRSGQQLAYRAHLVSIVEHLGDLAALGLLAVAHHRLRADNLQGVGRQSTNTSFAPPRCRCMPACPGACASERVPCEPLPTTAPQPPCCRSLSEQQDRAQADLDEREAALNGQRGRQRRLAGTGGALQQARDQRRVLAALDLAWGQVWGQAGMLWMNKACQALACMQGSYGQTKHTGAAAAIMPCVDTQHARSLHRRTCCTSVRHEDSRCW